MYYLATTTILGFFFWLILLWPLRVVANILLLPVMMVWRLTQMLILIAGVYFIGVFFF